MQLKESYADHLNNVIIDPLDISAAKILIARHNNTIVGTTRANFVRDGDSRHYLDYYGLCYLSQDELNKVSISTRLMIQAYFCGTTLALRLISENYRRGLENGIETNYCDCDPGVAPLLIRLGWVPFSNLKSAQMR